MRDREQNAPLITDLWKGRPELTALVAGVLRSAINAHGPITIKNHSSAAKRVANQLWATTIERVNGTPKV